MLYPPKAVAQVAAEQPGPVTAPAAGGVATKAFDPNAPATEATKIRLAGQVLHDRPLDEVTREIATDWKRLHPAAAASDTKK